MYWNGPCFHSYPDATEEELQVDDVCIICRETMTTAAKKLPCNHIFHTTCLRSWFQRQQTCPTCRRDVLRAAPTPPQATPPQPPQPPQAQPPQNSMSKNFNFFLNYLFLKYQVQMICVWFNFSFWGYGWHASTDVAPAPCPSPSAKCSPARLVPICIFHQKDEKVHVHTTVCRDFNTIQWRSHNWFSGISCLTGSTQAPQSGTSTATVSSTFTQPSVSAPTTTTFPGMPATGGLPTGMPPMMPMVPLMMPFG